MHKTIPIDYFLNQVIHEKYAPHYTGNTNLVHTAIVRTHHLDTNLRLEGTAVYEGAKMFAPFVDILPTSDALNYIGYTAVQVRELLKNLKSNKNPIILVGFGGLNGGVMYWLEKLCSLTDSSVLQNTVIHVFDDEVYEWDNMGRFPFLSQSDELNKALWYEEHNRKTGGVGKVIAHPELLTEDYIRMIKSQHENRTERECMPIVIGGPDSATRPMLSQSEYCNFIFTAHYMQNLNVWINPTFDDKSVDSYGGLWADAFPFITLLCAINVLKALKVTKHRSKKIGETHVLGFSMSSFVSTNDTENTVGIIPKNYQWSNIDGYRHKASR